jgi:hypothetical protein
LGAFQDYLIVQFGPLAALRHVLDLIGGDLRPRFIGQAEGIEAPPDMHLHAPARTTKNGEGIPLSMASSRIEPNREHASIVHMRLPENGLFRPQVADLKMAYFFGTIRHVGFPSAAPPLAEKPTALPDPREHAVSDQISPRSCLNCGQRLHLRLCRNMTDRIAARRAMAMQHVTDGRRVVERQRHLVGVYERRGGDTCLAVALLAEFERTLRVFEDDLEEILKQQDN